MSFARSFLSFWATCAPSLSAAALTLRGLLWGATALADTALWGSKRGQVTSFWICINGWRTGWHSILTLCCLQAAKQTSSSETSPCGLGDERAGDGSSERGCLDCLHDSWQKARSTAERNLCRCTRVWRERCSRFTVNLEYLLDLQCRLRLRGAIRDHRVERITLPHSCS